MSASAVMIKSPEPRRDDALMSLSVQDTMTLGDILAKSGFFSDSKSAAQAVAKILAGRELGFGPIASMTGIHIIEGKPAVGADLIAQAIKRSGKYDYKIIKCDDAECSIDFYESGQKVGNITCTIAEAKEKGYAKKGDGSLKKNWQQFPSDMLFARAISRGRRRYCPDAFYAPVYAIDELDEHPLVEAPQPSAIEAESEGPAAERDIEPQPRESASITAPQKSIIQQLGHDLVELGIYADKKAAWVDAVSTTAQGDTPGKSRLEDWSEAEAAWLIHHWTQLKKRAEDKRAALSSDDVVF